MRVEFSVKELLVNINKKLDDLTTLTHDKTDKAEFQKLEDKVDVLDKRGSTHAQDALNGVKSLETRINNIERDMVRQDTIDEFERKNRVNIAGIIITALLSAFALVVTWLTRGH